ncbi:MAG: hypothetical protein J2P13_12915 [Acidobacteria bacterium]|nr:hypothetical protein [Acidobacteriota bacterium]
MSFSGSQQADLMQVGLDGSYSWYLENEGGFICDTPNAIPIAWVIGISLAEGIAYTKALGETANVWPEPEWGWEAGSPGMDIGPLNQQQWLGGATGGFIRSW